MSFVEDYVNGLRDGLVASGEWQGMDRKAQNKRLKDGIARGSELHGKFSAISQAAKLNGAHLNLAAARKQLVKSVLDDYRMRTILMEQAMIDQLKSIVKYN